MSPNLRNDSKERRDDLKRRINALTVRVNMALHKYRHKPLAETLQDPLPLAHDTTQSRLGAIKSSSSHTTPTPPPPTSIIQTGLSLTPYRPFLPETLQEPRPLAHDTTQSRLRAINSSSSHTTPTPPPPTSRIQTGLSLTPYRPFLPETLQEPRPFAHDTTQSRLRAIKSSSSHTTPTTPPPTSRIQTGLSLTPYRPFLPETLQEPRPLAHDTTQSRLRAIKSSSSHTTPTPPPPTSRIQTGLSLTPYRSFSPPRHPPPNIPLPPIPTLKPSFYEDPSVYFPKPPVRQPSGTARCIEAGNMAADIIDTLPQGCRRIALLVFDQRYPPNERIDARFLPPDERRTLVVRGKKIVPVRKQRRRRPTLAVVPEE